MRAVGGRAAAGPFGLHPLLIAGLSRVDGSKPSRPALVHLRKGDSSPNNERRTLFLSWREGRG